MKIKLNIFILMMIMIFFFGSNVNSYIKGKPVQSKISKGAYIPFDIVTPTRLKRMPIPSSNENYAFYQSIGKISNVVIGEFQVGERVITLISDKNVDGKVDLAVHWFVDLKRMDVEPKPQEYCSSEKFAGMKDEIVNGKSDTLSPNPEGLSYLKVLLKTPGNCTKVKHGIRVAIRDTDEASKERISYFFSTHPVDGSDLVFNVKYYNLGTARVSPVINYGVFCRKSFDSFATEIVKKLMKEVNIKIDIKTDKN